MIHSEQTETDRPAGRNEIVTLDEAHELKRCVEAMQSWVRARGGSVVGPMALEHLATGGKLLRARLAIRAGYALGARAEARISWAAACELAHNATLVHDDLQDGDSHRRGQPTCWKRHGMAQAINVGDLLLMLPTYGIANTSTLSGTCRLSLCELLANRMSDVIGGQGLECQMTKEPCPDLAAYETMVAGKTSALFELPVMGAALAAGLSHVEAARLSAPFRELGVIFQIQDDCIDLIGDKGRREVGSDLKEGKVSAVVVQHITDHPQSREALLALLLTPRDKTSPELISKTIASFVDEGTVAELSKMMHLRSLAAIRHTDPRLQPLFESLVRQILSPAAAPLSP